MAMGCTAQGCKVPGYTEPAAHMMTAARQAEVASSRLVVAAVAAAARIEVVGIGVAGHTAAAVEAQAIGSHH